MESGVLKDLLREEERERRLPAMLSHLRSIEGNPTGPDWMDVMSELQHRLVRQKLEQLNSASGDPSPVTDAEVERGVHILRTADSLYPHDPEFTQISVYRRHNLAQRGSLRVGDPALDVPLLRMDGSPCTLFELIDAQHQSGSGNNSNRNKSTLVIASSRS
jgi:hypothetical protein